jgi:hypothetical protein
MPKKIKFQHPKNITEFSGTFDDFLEEYGNRRGETLSPSDVELVYFIGEEFTTYKGTEGRNAIDKWLRTNPALPLRYLFSEQKEKH